MLQRTAQSSSRVSSYLGFGRALRGRPRKGEVAAGSSSKNVRMQDAEWEALEVLADKRSLSVHAAMREALVHGIARAANADAKKEAAAPLPPEEPKRVHGRVVRSSTKKVAGSGQRRRA
jgi:hypothetical protein